MSEPSNSDIAAQNRLQPTASTVDGQIQPGDGSSVQPAQPSAPSMPLPRPQTQASTPAGQPGQQLPQNVPPQVRKSLFDRILEGMAGGPTRVTDPQTGITREVPMTKRSITQNILAAAIHGVITGASASANAPSGPAGTNTPANFAALGGGYQGTQQKLQQLRNAPQAAVDEQSLRQYNTMKRNIDLHGAMLTLGNASKAAQDAAEEPGKTLWSQAQELDQSSEAGVPKLMLSNAPMTADALMAKYPQMSRQNFLLVGHQDMVDPTTRQVRIDPTTGQPYREPLFVPINPEAKMPMSAELKAMIVKNDPSMESQISMIPDNTPIGLGFYLNHSTQHIEIQGATDALKDSQKQINKLTGNTSSTDFENAIQKDPVLRKNSAVIGRYFGHGNDPAEAIEAMRKDKAVDSPVIDRVSSLLGLGTVDESGKSVQQRLLDKAAQDKAAEKKGGYADASMVKAFPANARTNYPNLTPGQIANVTQSLGAHPTQADFTAADNKLQAISNSNHQARLADQGLDEKQQKQLFDYGVVGTGANQQRLTLDNAPDEMLVNQHTGNPIPNKSLSAVKASQSEVNRAQFAGSTLHLIGALRKLQESGNLPNAPLLGGVTNSVLSKAGITGEDAQKAMTEISLLQSAATGAHVGGRFSTQVLDKMNKLLSLNMNDKQFEGSLSAIEDTMQGYKDNGGRYTVAEWRALPEADRQRLMGGETGTAGNAGNATPGTKPPANNKYDKYGPVVQ